MNNIANTIIELIVNNHPGVMSTYYRVVCKASF